MKAEFGSVSSCTMQPRDLIPAFEHQLRYLRGSVPRDLYNDIRAWEAGSYEDPSGLVDDLFDALDEYAPAYGYFGAHPGDGADYGFWLWEDWEQSAHDNDALFVDDTSEVPGACREPIKRDPITGKFLSTGYPVAYSGEVVHINDHGNVTLYNCRRGKLTEVWAVV